MRRKLLPVLAASLIMALSGCTSAPRYHYEVRDDLSIRFTNADSVIESVRRGLKECSPRITITYRSSSDNMSDIPDVVREIMSYAYAETDDPAEGDYIYHRCGGYEIQYRSERTTDGYTYAIEIFPSFYTDAEQEQKVTALAGKVLGEIIRDGMSDWEKAGAIHDYVCGHVKYDLVHKKNEHYHLKATAYAALVNGTAVCQGYSALMYRLLREAGIEARVVTGELIKDGAPEYHAWNIVKIGELWYNVDATADSMTQSRDMFLKGRGFFDDHIRDDIFLTESFDLQYPVSETDWVI